mmetsp:Transcript_19620/g.40999  ORF Transcript_19620/g.40999 Transcript_19620/m.40999 type:complete len:334 (-) Transcript_19620:38-1039(-)
MAATQPNETVVGMPLSASLGGTPVFTYEAPHLCADSDSFISATVYCPSTGGSLPSIVIVGGWLCEEHVLAAWGPFLASHGIVAMTIGNSSPNCDLGPERCKALLDASKALQSENVREGSKIFGRLDTSRRAVMGYSLGGGGAQLAALDDPSLKCAIALAPDSYGHASFSQKLTDSVPMLFLVGNADSEAPHMKQALPHYNMTTAPKLYFEIKNGDHFVVTGPSGGNRNDFESDRGFEICCNCLCTYSCADCVGPRKLGTLRLSAPCPRGYGTGPSGLASDNAPRGAIGGVALAWLQLFLQGDESARSRLLQRPGIASRFESEGVQLLPEEMQR